MSDILKKYVCLNPFRYLDVQPDTQFICCPSWCPTDIQETDDIEQNWFSKTTADIRKSVTDGSYSHCNHKVCPSLSQLINTEQVPPNSSFIPIEEFHDTYDLENFKGLPEQLLFGFDKSCNLRCPSCRSQLVPNDSVESTEHKHKLDLLTAIEDKFSESMRSIMVTGSGDPIYSKLYRDYLINFDETKYPNFENIHMITNGVLLNEKMWNKLKSKKFIKTMEVSIDAGTKETYENVTRLNGDWDALIDNLNFISTQTTIKYLACSMVISKYNYKEMETFYNLISNIFKNSSFTLSINFRQIVHWYTSAYSIKDISNLSVFDQGHPEFDNFLIELKKIHGKQNVDHNFHHLL